MDQMRKLMQWLQRYHFWVLSVVAVAIALACWYFCSGTLGQQFAQHQATIEGGFRAQDEIASREFHPNAEIIEAQRKQNGLRVASVADTWHQLYDRQRAEALKWPQNELGSDFCDHVDQLKFGDDIPRDLRETYRDYINRHFQELPKIIQAPVIEGGTAGGGFGGRGGATRGGDGGRSERGLGGQPVDEDYVCEWLDQQAVRDELWFPETPSPLRIWVTQEDLWAYRTILNVIANTNAGADRPSNAKVRIIESLEVGQLAAQYSRSPGRITLAPEVNAAADLMGDGGGRGRSNSPASFDGGRAGSGEPTPEQERVNLLSLRYLDEQGKPIPFDGGTTDYQTAFGREYKRLPIRVVLRMDERALTDLISECANQPLPVEVQEVRKNPVDGGGGVFGRARSPGGFGSSGSGRTSAIETFPLNPHLATIVIQGVIYIYNEPNETLLQSTSVAALAQ